MSQPTDVQTLLARAMTSLITTEPFFASILLHLPRKEVTWCKTMATDGTQLVYNADFVRSLSRDELKGVLCHEVAHVAGLHPFRMGKRKLKAWNIACDAVVNAIVLDAEMTLPADRIPPIRDKSAEEIYRDLPEGDDGEPDEDGNTDPGGMGGVIAPRNAQGQPCSKAEMVEKEEVAKVMVAQAVNTAKRAGKMPRGMDRIVEEAKQSRVPWKELLSQFVDQFSKNDYSWRRINQRYVASGIVLATLHTPAIGKIIMANDMSGSVDVDMSKQICGELLGCMDMYTENGQDSELTVAWFDHDVYPQVVREATDLQPRGGGGTSFSVVFDWMREAGEYPLGVAVVTDGQCDDFGDPPECPVMWILTEPNRQFKPPFGSVAFTIDE